MSTLTVTTRGRVTLRKDILRHMGVGPGDKLELERLPGGRVALRAARPTGTIDAFIGLLAGKTDRVASLDEIKGASAPWPHGGELS